MCHLDNQHKIDGIVSILARFSQIVVNLMPLVLAFFPITRVEEDNQVDLTKEQINYSFPAKKAFFLFHKQFHHSRDKRNFRVSCCNFARQASKMKKSSRNL